MGYFNKIFVIVASSFLVLTGLIAVSSQRVTAANAADFNPGHIISDGVMSNKDSMSANDIQNFLNSKMPVCDTWHAGSGSNQPPFTCLKDYHENGLSAAQIIWNKAQEFNINPQVMLVLLQKEQGLITDTWPWEVQYRSATGYGCPDSTPGVCDSQYYGFTNQVHWANTLFRRILDQAPTWTNFYPPGNRYIQYNPNAGCGGTNITIANLATSALYNYTPYQPNGAALNNLYGGGDSCSAYGNRNFWRDFIDWFGDTGEFNETNISWNYENLEGDPGSVSGYNSATGQQPNAITLGSTLHVFSYDVSGGNLRHASIPNGGNWSFENLDGASTTGGRLNADVGKTPANIVYGGGIHTFYYDVSNGNLRHAWSDSNGANWQFETLDGQPGSNGRLDSNLGLNPTVTVLNNELQLFYYDVSNGNLRHGWTTGSGATWNFEDLDGHPGAVGGSNYTLGEHPIAGLYNGTLQVFYYDVSNGNLRHGWNNPTTGWHFENLDGDAGSVARNSANLGLFPTMTTHGSTLQLFYYDGTHGNLRHAWSDATGWHFENLDGDQGSIFRRNTNSGITPVTLSHNNVLYLLYYDQQTGDARYGYSDSGGWHKASLDGGSGSLACASNSNWCTNADLGVDATATIYNGSLQVYYYDYSHNNLRHAWGAAP